MARRAFISPPTATTLGFELANGLADALFTLGVCTTDEVRSISLEEAAEKWAGGDTLLAELGFASKQAC